MKDMQDVELFRDPLKKVVLCMAVVAQHYVRSTSRRLLTIYLLGVKHELD